MDYTEIKMRANSILKNKIAECSYIEYKKSAEQSAKILKTICAFGNNFYDNELQYIFLGVEEKNDEHNKAVPLTPIIGIEEGLLEKCKNQINSLRPYLYPNVSFEVLANEYEGRNYLLIIVPRQTGGPFMVNETAEKDKLIKLKPGRYIRIETDSRLARVDEEYNLLRKFSNFHFCSLTNQEATINDLNVDYLDEYIEKTRDRKIMGNLNKLEIARSLKLIDKNDPSTFKLKNYAVLMFTANPEQFIPYAYAELIVDMFGTKRKMESKKFTGPIWKQYQNIVSYINDNFLNVMVVRDDGKSENRKVANYPFVAVEELVANAIVHNNYENRKPIQIYISEKQINIINYNKPLPPLSTKDLNDRRIFNERDTENPEIRDMFKALGIIESFGTGIGEAKRAMEENESPELYYKIFSASDNFTSVVIPVNEEYRSIKTGEKTKERVEVESESQVFKKKILESDYSNKVKNNLLNIYNNLHNSVFSNADVVNTLSCSETTATDYLKKLNMELELIVAVNGMRKGKYRFKEI